MIFFSKCTMWKLSDIHSIVGNLLIIDHWSCSERDACYQTKHDKTCIDSHIRNISQHHSLSQHQSPATGHCKWVENILSHTHSLCYVYSSSWKYFHWLACLSGLQQTFSFYRSSLRLNIAAVLAEFIVKH